MSAIETALAGGVFDTAIQDTDSADLRRLVDDIGRRSFQRHVGHRRLPQRFDADLWRDLEETGLARLTSTPEFEAGPVELAIVLRGLARHAAAVPIAETDLIAAWLCDLAGLKLPEGPLAVAISEAREENGRICATAVTVPWAQACEAVLIAVREPDAVRVALADPAEVSIESGHNLAGEPRDAVSFDVPVDRFRVLSPVVADELTCRGAWARCVQIVGALDAAAELSVTHTRERVQFGRSLSAFQAVQHSLAAMAGEVESVRAAATLAVAAASDYGFDAAQTDYAVTVAKVAAGRAVDNVSTIAHQLHGAIGTTIEHDLWLFTLRAQSWAMEFGSTGHWARRLGRAALKADNPWDFLVGNNVGGWARSSPGHQEPNEAGARD